jgi:hypothetical protein
MTGFLLVMASAGTAVLGMLAVRRTNEQRVLVACHEVGGYLLAVTGTLYAVLLGLIVVDAMSTFQEAHQTFVQESNALADIVLLARGTPGPQHQEMVRLAVEYAGLVTGPEWEAMDRGQISHEARGTALRLIEIVKRSEPRTESEKTIHDAQLEAAVQLWNCRRARTILAAQRIPTLKWFILIVGGVITVIFTYFFVIEHPKIQAAMTALVAILISLNIFLVMMFGYPFSGELRVDPTCFTVIRELARDPRLGPDHGPTESRPSARHPARSGAPGFGG